jgi:type VI secretion system protein ImpG
MDPRLLDHYERELKFLRGMGAEFAQAYPKIAGRLGIEQFDCLDPYVERLIESSAFLAARVQLKLAAQFPRFTQHLIDAVYPHYLAPLPSMAVIALQPDSTEGSLIEGVPVPRGTTLRSILGRQDRTACEFRTAQTTTLWPIEVTQADYLPSAGAVAALGVPDVAGQRAGLRVRLRTTHAGGFDTLPLDALTLFLMGTASTPHRLYEQLVGNLLAVVVRPAQRATPQTVLPGRALRAMGFEDDEAILPPTGRTFSGHRLLQEYFALPERFLFVETTGLGKAVRACAERELDMIFVFSRTERALDRAVSKDNFGLFCTPVVNLFPRRADRSHLMARTQHHIVPDRTRPHDYEVFSIERIDGYGASIETITEFQPLYATGDVSVRRKAQAFFTMVREPRVLNDNQRRGGPVSSYAGSEIYVSLVDGQEAPYRGDIRQIEAVTLCTNRDLPMSIATGAGTTDFTLDIGVPVKAIRCMVGPSRPRPSRAEGEMAWRLISMFSLNYLSIIDAGPVEGASTLRDFLSLFAPLNDPSVQRQIEGLMGISDVPIVRRLPHAGPIAFGRGLEITLQFDERAFEGQGMFLLGAVLERFLARWVSINSFTETVVQSDERGQVMRWPIRFGRRPVL